MSTTLPQVLDGFVITNVTAVSCEMVTEFVVIHPFESITVTVKIPAEIPEIVAVVAPLFHK